MILNALIDYYNRLEADPEQDVAPFGFARERISFCIVLHPDGRLAGFHDLREEIETGGRAKRKQLIPRRLIVPDRGGRSSGVKANFLWDNTGYVLGLDGKGKAERSRRTFEAFRELHRSFVKRADDPGLRAVCAFLDTWEPERSGQLEKWEEACDTNVVFRLAGQAAFVHDSKALREAWLEFASREYETQRGVSLLTGRDDQLARLHPMINGIVGAQTSGASMVSFNLDAFESYRKSQSYNAPVGVVDAFRYATALSRLVADNRRRVRLADATIVFWAERPTPFEDDFFGVVESMSAEDAETLSRQRGFLQSLRSAWLTHDRLADAGVPFYFLGLSPNASRLSVRFWLAGTVQQFAERLGRHFADLEIVGPNEAPPITLRRLVLETARPKNGWPDEGSVSPLLSGAVLRSVLAGTPYPAALLTSVIERIRAEGFADSEKRRDWRDATHRRAAILKAYLIRNEGKEIPVSLDRDHPDAAYHLGRLFAILEKTQEEAYDNRLNATIKDRYFSSASANPVAAFPRLLRLHAHHLEKIEHAGRRTNLEKLVQEVCSHVSGFPSHLPLHEQGLFFIGYYHQRQDLFTSKKSTTETSDPTMSAESAREG